MGTNYYLLDDKGSRHIGKSSAGWKFLFEKRPWEQFNIDDWKRTLQMGCIYDEYNMKYTFKDFWNLVESKQKEKPHLSKEFPWYEQIEGYDFANNEFS